MYPCNFYECFTTGSRPLVVFGQTPVTVESSERPFNNPTLGLHDKANLAHPFFDYHSQPTPANSGMTQGRIQVGVTPDLFQPLDCLPQPLHHSDAAHTRSGTEAGTTINAHSKPRVSTATNRLRPTIFFPRIGSPWAALFGGFYRLAVEDGHRGLGFFPDRRTNFGPQGVVDLVPSAVFLPEAEVVEDDTIRGQVVG